MGKFTEKELDKLNHAQLCDLLLEEGIIADKKESKAELKARLLEINTDDSDADQLEDSVEVTEEADLEEVINSTGDVVADKIFARRREVSTGIATVSGSLEDRILFRRNLTGTGSSRSIESVINERRSR